VTTLLICEKRNQCSILVAMLRWVFLAALTCACITLLPPDLPANQAEQDFVQYLASPRVRVVPDLVYARYGQRALLLDLYLPMNPAKRPFPGVIVVRGGGWMVNDRKRFAHIASALAERGLAAASIEYRNAEEAAFPGAIQDVKAAVRWMRANSRTYGIDPEAIATLGGSSGAHMALLAGLTFGVPEFEGHGGYPATSSRIQGVVAMATPADLLTLSPGNQETVAKFLHTTANEDRTKWQWASPINHIARDNPPVLLLHGANDESVPATQSMDFEGRCREVGARVEVYILPGAPHAFWNYRPWFSDAMDHAANFLLRMR
jgi:acetyl esterase/lipase